MFSLYLDPISTTCRPLLLLMHRDNIDITIKPISLFSGDHLKPEFTAINPNRAVPVLQQGDFILTESSVILRYIADQTGSPAYPRDTRVRARIDQWLDWFNTLFMLDYVYGLVYSRVLPGFNLTETAQADRLSWHHARVIGRLAVLNDALAVGPYLLGQQLTIADYFGACLTTTGEFIQVDLTPYPNIGRWLTAMKTLPGWRETQGPFNTWVETYRSQIAAA